MSPTGQTQSRLTNHLRCPIFTQRSDLTIYEFQKRDFLHVLAPLLYNIIKVHFPLGNAGSAIYVHTEQGEADVTLPLHNFFLPIGGYSLMSPNRLLKYQLMVDDI